MEELHWLADLVSDCHAFGEKHDNELVIFSALGVINAMERDFGLKFMLLSRASAPNGTWVTKLDVLPPNAIRLPYQPHRIVPRTRSQSSIGTD